MTTLNAAYATACAYWDSLGHSSAMMAIRAGKGVSILGGSRKLSSLTAADGVALLSRLNSSNLSRSTIAATYAAFKRMLALSGVSCAGWPKAATPPRRVREPMSRKLLDEVTLWLDKAALPETADLCRVLGGTGMRVEVEALSFDAVRVIPPSGCAARPVGASSVRVAGKGGHERIIPVAAPLGLLLSDPERTHPMRRLSYGGHLKRWNKALFGVQGAVIGKRDTPHAIRHLYATEAYARSGGNLHVVRELLGHADINTTARYIGIDEEAMRRAAGC